MQALVALMLEFECLLNVFFKENSPDQGASAERRVTITNTASHVLFPGVETVKPWVEDTLGLVHLLSLSLRSEKSHQFTTFSSMAFSAHRGALANSVNIIGHL